MANQPITQATGPAYVDNAVFQPGTGGVFSAPVGTNAPTLEDISNWITGDRTKAIGEWEPIGYTSLETLPGIGTETEGGEKKGVWENPDFRVTPITSTDTVKVQPVQWSPVPLSHRFGANVTIDPATGQVDVPSTFTSVETAIMVVFMDGDTPLVLVYYRTSASPDGDIEPDPENYMTIPVKYTVLSVTGSNRKMSILAYHLRDKDNDNQPDTPPTSRTGSTSPRTA